MTTLRMPRVGRDSGEAGDRREAGGGGSRPPWRQLRGWGDSAERAGLRWVALAWIVVLVLLLVQDPGRMTFDTKLGVDIDPLGFYERLWHLWNPLENLGSIADQYIGYAFPMGAFYLLAHGALHIPVWVTERLWMSLLAAAGFWGIVRLAEAVGIGSRSSRLLAGAAFALWPTFTILLGSTSGAVLPGVLAPWAVLPLVRARGNWQAAARSAVVVACMGGINATSTLAALALPFVYIVTRPGRRRWALLGWWVPAVVAATAWWVGPLLYQGVYGFNFLPYIEQATTTTRTMSAAAALRGTGNWVAYLNFGEPWLTAGSVMTGAGWAAAASALAVAVGLAGIARRDLPEGPWLRCTLGLAALYGLAGYPGPLGGPLAAQVQEVMDGALSALRNVYKIEPAMAAVLVLGAAHLLGRVRWRPEQARLSVRYKGLGKGLRVAGCVVAVAALAGLALPYLNGQALQPGSFTGVPGYWQQAANWLAAHDSRDNTLVVPADSHGIYTWGQPIDEPLEPLGSSPWTERNLVPYSGGGVADLMNAAEQAIESGQATPGLAAYLARAGIRYVLVRNDLDPAQPGYTSPAVVHATLAASGFTRAASFGAPAPTGPIGKGTALQAEAIEPAYPPVEIFQASAAADRPSGPASMLPASSTALVDGGPGSLLQLSGQHQITPGQPAVVAGQDGSGVAPASRQLVTDGLRRADTAFGLPNDNTSYTYTANGTIPPDDPQGAGGKPPRQLLPASTAGHQTVAVLKGASSVTASSAGSWLWELPQADPAYAFDGNPATAWTEASPASAAGQWIQINFSSARTLPSSAAIRLLDDIPRPVATRLDVTTAAGSAVTSTSRTGAVQPLRLPAGKTSWLRITIAAASGGTPGGPGAGISDVSIPGVRVTPYLQPSQAGSGGAGDPGGSGGSGASATSFSFQRAPATSLGLPGQSPEPDLNRTFTTAAAGRYAASGTVTPVPGAGLNALLGSLDSGSAQLHISASSVFGSLPQLSPRNLLAGTGWVAASPHASLHLSWSGKRTVGEVDLTAMATGLAAQPTRALISSPAGKQDVPIPRDGIVTFPPMKTNQLTISFPGVESATAYNPLLGRDQQLPVGLGSLSVPALSGLNTGIPKPGTKFSLPCGKGPSLTVDGHTYRTAVSGTVKDLLKLTPMPLKVCGSGSGSSGSSGSGGSVALGAGRHYLSSPGTGVALAVTGLSLTPSGSGSASGSGSGSGSEPASGSQGGSGSPGGPARSLHVGTWQAEYRTMTVGAGAQSYLEVHQAASPGWTATLDGKSLNPVTLDGWQQAFVVPAGAGGTVVMSYTPASGYHEVLIGSAAAFLIVLVAACWRRRRGDGIDGGGIDGGIDGGGRHARDTRHAVGSWVA
ncbi:MAG: DUF3367 domain-containing protein, partial [Nocardiopsaceae bacterium]|nr:DUF3367 domain-containing protein [Nocardiopsaceae bacterium]